MSKYLAKKSQVKLDKTRKLCFYWNLLLHKFWQPLQNLLEGRLGTSLCIEILFSFPNLITPSLKLFGNLWDNLNADFKTLIKTCGKSNLHGKKTENCKDIMLWVENEWMRVLRLINLKPSKLMVISPEDIQVKHGMRQSEVIWKKWKSLRAYLKTEMLDRLS